MTPDAQSSQRWKIHSLNNTVSSATNKYLIIALTETWLKPHMADAQIAIQDFTVFRADRVKRGRGGVLLYISDKIPVTKTEVYDDDICQAVVCISPPSSLIIACIYKPCDACDSSFSALLTFLRKSITYETDNSHAQYTVVVLGDFNFPELWLFNCEKVTATSLSEKWLIDFTNELFLSQCVDVPTRQNNILDLFLTNRSNLVYNISSVKTELSDHNMIDILLPVGELLPKSVTYSPVVTKTTLSGFHALNLFKADFNSIIAELNEINWESIFNSSTLEDFPKLLQKTVLKICQDHTPLKSISPNRKNPSYRIYHTLLRKKRKLKQRLLIIESRNPSSPNIIPIKKQIQEVLEKLKSHIHAEIDKREKIAISKIKTNPKYFFSYTKKKARIKGAITQLFDNHGKLVTDTESMANLLQDQFVSAFSNPLNPDKVLPDSSQCVTATGTGISFPTISNFSFDVDDVIRAIDEININSSCNADTLPAIVLKKCKNTLAKPLHIMWTESLKAEFVPTTYKKQIINPTHKKGSKAIPSNYRPISITPHEIKIFERILRDKLVAHLESNNLISCNQHGFRKGKSCLTQLLKHYDNILTNLSNNNETDSIFLDFAKAFDKVDHDILLLKVKNFGITGKIYNWIKNFLSNRYQAVVVDNVLSYLAKVISGIPQGTVLGPILFLIFINDIASSIKHSTLGCFADDTRASKAISVSSDSTLLQEDINLLIQWAIDNNMKMHDDKFVYMNFNIRPHNFLLAQLPFYSNSFQYFTSINNCLEASDTAKDLGIIFTQNLSWSAHISAITKKARGRAGWVLSVFKNRSPRVMLLLYKSLVRSLLEYACPLWNGLPLSDLREIEAIQRSFTHKIICPSDVQSYWQRLSFLNLMSLQRRRERYMILHMWKILNNKTSNDLNICFHESLRFGLQATVPPMNSTNQKAKTLYDMSFAVKGPQLWNSIPADITHLDTINCFKTHLDKFLHEVPDQPPITGYPTLNNNSLLEWCHPGHY